MINIYGNGDKASHFWDNVPYVHLAVCIKIVLMHDLFKGGFGESINTSKQGTVVVVTMNHAQCFFIVPSQSTQNNSLYIPVKPSVFSSCIHAELLTIWC